MSDYRCGTCEAVDCKLWRQSHVFANQVDLICWKCLEEKGHEVLVNNAPPQMRTDQVYDPDVEAINYVPAIPDLDGKWWGYTSVPQWWVEWWKALPDKSDDCTHCRGAGRLAEFECLFCRGSGSREAELHRT